MAIALHHGRRYEKYIVDFPVSKQRRARPTPGYVDRGNRFWSAMLALNHERYAEGVKAGLHKKGKRKPMAGGKEPRKTEDKENEIEVLGKQMGLFA